MGLDVYLYRYEDHAKAKAAEKQYEDQAEANWQSVGGYSAATDEQKEEIRKKNRELAESLGYTFSCPYDHMPTYEVEMPPGETRIEEPSAKYPDHYFKVGYFHSSYNDGGIERVVGNLVGGRCLYDIFCPSDEYEFQPNWNEALIRTRAMLEAFDAKTANGSFRCFSEEMNPYGSPAQYQQIDEKRALELFNEQNSREHGDGGYSNRDGSFFFGDSALKVRGLIPGFSYGRPCVYVIHESDMSWYRQALEIVEETILWVMAQHDPQKFYLRWSS